MKEIYRSTMSPRGTLSSQGTRTRVMLNDEDDHGDDGVSRCYYRVETALAESKEGFFEDSVTIDFQAGLVAEEGINGIQDEGLLAVLIHRYEQFQEGPLACVQNEATLKFLRLAHWWMEERKSDRIARGVAGMAKV